MKTILFFSLIFLSGTLIAQEQKKVFIMEIKAEIDPRMNRYVKLALEKAEDEQADLILIEMDTYGGAVADAKDIVEALLDYPKPIWVFIDKDAASAGALISIACDSIYMSPGSSIGAATVVVGDGTAAPDKYQSYMRSTMRSTAEVNGRNPLIAEGMVDQNIEVPGISEKGQVITFSTSEAIKNGFCEGEFKSREELFSHYGLDKYQVIEFKLSSSERIIAFFLNPFISGILILIIIGGIYFELQTPGIGFPLAAAGIALVLYLVPYYLNGLAESWEIIALVVGIILIGVEIFVIPGFGFAGISGIVLFFGSLILIMLNNDTFDFSMVPWSEITKATATLIGGMSGAFLLMFFGGVRLSNSKAFSKIALVNTLQKEDGYTSNFYAEKQLVGKIGIAYSVLRPSGKVEIDHEIYDAYTSGGFIEQGQEIVVVSDGGTSLKVKPKS